MTKPFLHTANYLTFFIVAGFTLSTTAFGLIDGTLEVGKRNAKWAQDTDTSNISSQVARAALHLDPIPLVPIGFGLGVYSETWSVSKEDQGLSSLSSYSLVPEIVAWIPLGDFRPSARVGYSIGTVYAGKASLPSATGVNTGAMALVGTGLHAAIGMEWNLPIVPLLSLLAHYEYAMENVKLAKDKVGDQDISASYKPVKLTSSAVLIGVKLGI
jgi:hypothetical protein